MEHQGTAPALKRKTQALFTHTVLYLQPGIHYICLLLILSSSFFSLHSLQTRHVLSSLSFTFVTLSSLSSYILYLRSSSLP